MPRLKVIGHRGARGLAPENTLVSLATALEYDVDGLEFDVRATKDKVAILNHDNHLINSAGRRLNLDDHTYSELKSAKSDLTTLDEALKFVNKRCLVFIEIKEVAAVAPAVVVIKKYYSHDLTGLYMGSFDKAVLEEVRSFLPKAQLMVNERYFGIRAFYRARKFRASVLDFKYWILWSGFIRRVKKSPYSLACYPLNSPVKAKRWAKYGLEFVITDFPDRFR